MIRVLHLKNELLFDINKIKKEISNFSNVVIDINTNKENLVNFFKNETIESYFDSLFNLLSKYNLNVILLSSCDVYDMVSSSLIDESASINDNMFPYIENLHKIEKLFNKFNFNSFILRIPLLLGENLKNSFIERKISEVLSGRVTESPEVPFYNFVDINDLKKVIDKAFKYLKTHQNTHEIINVVNSVTTPRLDFTGLLISLSGCKDLYDKHPDAFLQTDRTVNLKKGNIACYIDNNRNLSSQKLEKLLNIKLNTNLKKSLDKSFVWYEISHLLNQKLTFDIKNKIDNLKDIYEADKFIFPYRQSELTNLEITQYFYHHNANKDLSARLKTKYNSLPKDEREEVIRKISTYLSLFEGKETKTKINGTKYWEIEDNVKNPFTSETILTEYDKISYLKELNYLKSLK